MRKPSVHKNLWVIIVLLIGLIAVAAIQFFSGYSTPGPRHVSMIVYADTSERWENIREGASMACADRNAKLDLITMLSGYDPDEQKEIVDRELEDGIDALLIAPCSSREIKEYIDSKNLKIPVIYLEKLDDPSPFVTSVGPDDHTMGYQLGEKIVEEESDIVTIAILSGNQNRDSVRLREQGLREAIDGRVGKIIDWPQTGDGSGRDPRTVIQKYIVSEATDVIVTFDNTTTDALLDALENLNHSCKVYSVSTSNKSVYNLYNKGIMMLEYPDEFSMGYIAAVYALDPVYAAGRYSHREIDYRLVGKENMYDEENQALLFPFVD